MPMLTATNHIPIWTMLDGELVSHFSMHEFESESTFLVALHPYLMLSLELVRRDLTTMYREDVPIAITCGIRTQAENDALAVRLGWTDEGGNVSRNSRHLPEWGGIAVDLKAKRVVSGPVPQKTLAKVCRQRFDQVYDNYSDGHVHADNRYGGHKARQYREEVEPAIMARLREGTEGTD